MRGLGFILTLLFILAVGSLAHADEVPSILVRPIFARILLRTPEGAEIATQILGNGIRATENDLARVLKTLAHPDNQPLALDLAARASEVEAVVDATPDAPEAALRRMTARELHLAPAAEGVVKFKGGETHRLNTASNLDFIGWDKRANVIEDRFIAGDSAARDLALDRLAKVAGSARTHAQVIQIMEFACESVVSASVELAHLQARQGAARGPQEVQQSLRLLLKAEVSSRIYQVFSPADWNRHERLVRLYRIAMTRVSPLIAALEKLR